MNLTIKNTVYSLLLILLTTFLFNSYYDYKVNNPSYKLSVTSTHINDGKLELYYDVGDGFNERDKMESQIVKGRNMSTFSFNNKTFFKKFRLDFGDNERVELITIESIKLQAQNKNIFLLNQREIIKTIEICSPNVEISKSKIKILKSDNQFDPYIEFKPLNRIIIPEWTYLLIILLPVLVFYFLSFYKEIKSVLQHKEIDFFFIILFIFSIPFKDAWTTLVALIWLSYLISLLVKRKIIKINLATLVCFILFSIPTIFGGPSNYNQINILLSFLVFGIISFYPIKRNFIRIRHAYFFIMGIIALVIFASWLNYIIYYAKYDDVTFYSYFSNIKYTNEHIREWFAFSHPAYISMFSIIGMFFSYESYKSKIIDKKQLILNLLITFVLIGVLGSRIALVIFLMINTTLILQKINYKKMLFVFFIIFSLGVFSTINKLDPIRHQLWSITISAIKEIPLFGYGLRSSKDIILNKELNYRNGYDSILHFNHPHNQYISYILEIGLLGFIVLLALLLIVNFKYKEKITNNYSIILFIWCILSIIESPFETSKPTFLFCFFLLITSESSIFKISLKSPFKNLR